VTPESSITIEQSEVFDLLSSFVDKSLVIYDESSGRYRLLETVRQYALDRLMETGEGKVIRNRHVGHFLKMAEVAEPHLTGDGQQEWLERLETEHENLRTAMDFCTGDSESAESGLRLLGSLGRFWIMRGRVMEGRRQCADILKDSDMVSASFSLAKALHAAGNLAYVNSDLREAKEFYKRAASMRHDIGDLAGEAGSLGNLATVAQSEGDIESARQQFEESLAILQELGQQRGIAVSLGCLGSVSKVQGDLDGAHDYFSRALDLNRQMGDLAAEANTLNNLGTVEKESGNRPAALAAFERALNINRKLGYEWEAALNQINLGISAREDARLDDSRACFAEGLHLLVKVGARRDMAECLDAWARLEAMRDLPARAARLMGASAMCREGAGAIQSHADRDANESFVAEIRRTMGDSDFELEFENGRAMTVDQAAQFALQKSTDA
jgi:tetratricopeptide (TPR) repeat protein